MKDEFIKELDELLHTQHKASEKETYYFAYRNPGDRGTMEFYNQELKKKLQEFRNKWMPKE